MSSLHNIILTGFSGTGKSRAGAEVARVLGWKFIDTDAEAVRRAGKPIVSIFSEDGEEAFRRLEGEVLQQACSGGQRVIATGGGMLMDPNNRKLVSDSGLVVGLEATPGDHRPAPGRTGWRQRPGGAPPAGRTGPSSAHPRPQGLPSALLCPGPLDGTYGQPVGWPGGNRGHTRLADAQGQPTDYR